MCSNDSPRLPAGDLAGRLRVVIDELAAALDPGARSAGEDVTARLAAAWALVAEADPELAARAAQYDR